MHLLAVVEYDGTAYNGFQSQTTAKRGKPARTIQDELERALAEFAHGAEKSKRVKITGGGRTDAGVHALGQTASFILEWQHDLETLRRALNAKLPRDVAVRSLRSVPEKFSARFDATSRTYRYVILNTPTREPLQERYVLWSPVPLNVESMQQAAAMLIGQHDFRAFGTPPQGSVNSVRTMRRSLVQRRGSYIEFEFEADGFLYRMVRRIVGTLLLVGKAKMTVPEFGEVLARKHPSGKSVPPQGLTLIEIKYALE